MPACRPLQHKSVSPGCALRLVKHKSPKASAPGPEGWTKELVNEQKGRVGLVGLHANTNTNMFVRMWAYKYARKHGSLNTCARVQQFYNLSMSAWLGTDRTEAEEV